MCQYSCEDGVMNTWHMVHLGSRAVGGAGLVMTEATAVSPEGRISPNDAGLWNDAQVEALKPIVAFIHSQGARAGIQLAHAGRKGSTAVPWEGGKLVPETRGGWTPVAPSAVAFSETYATPVELNEAMLSKVRDDFRSATERAIACGFDVIELHFAHGYLVHEFLSPLSNRRRDQYGGTIENRMRFAIELVKIVREVWPKSNHFFARISATDWTTGGWTVEDSVTLARELSRAGVDLIDCSTGGNVPDAKIPTGPSYQVSFAETVRREAAVLTGAVGMITTPEQAEGILATGQADAVLLARELLRDPHWPIHAARKLGVEIHIPNQYFEIGVKMRHLIQVTSASFAISFAASCSSRLSPAAPGC